MKKTFFFCLFLYILLSCTSKKQNEKKELTGLPVSTLSGKELSLSYCGRCHAYVEPNLLPKETWNYVLPAMGFRLGIYRDGIRPDSLFDAGISGDIVRQANIYPEKPVLSNEDWKKIENYYRTLAPDSVPVPLRKHPIRMGLRNFMYRETSFSHRPALTTMVKILPAGRGIVYGDGKSRNNVLTFLNPDLSENYSLSLPATPVDYYEKANEMYLTTAGKGIFPSDAPEGAVMHFKQTGSESRYQFENLAISNLQRPVSMAYSDLDQDGLEDVVACEFGNQTGKLAWYKNDGRGGYSKKVLRQKPGSITAIIKDANHDGLPDIYVLMAQGDEGVFLYENKGSGNFEEKRLLTFLPLNGSQHIELADFNKDGFDDIVYVCGDNADKSPVLKSYHGIYIFLNDRKGNFNQAYFYQMNGAYKAIVRDFDLDGDLDIAAISFFPDYLRYPEESFIYLENKGHLKFDDYSFPEATKGRWAVMDAGDIDGDGDTDLVLGSFVYFLAQGDTTGLGKKWLSTGPSVIVLENTVRHK